jgi:hypothetical protein
MPAGFHTTKGVRRIRFTVNVGYEGVDYGPDFEDAEVTMPPNDAFRFVREGRAVYADEGPAEAVIDPEKSGLTEPGKKGGRR